MGIITLMYTPPAQVHRDLAKLSKQKQGFMQNLLTSQIRIDALLNKQETV